MSESPSPTSTRSRRSSSASVSRSRAARSWRASSSTRSSACRTRGREIVMLRPPDGGTRIELSSFVRPDHEPGSPTAMANELGLRNVCFEVARPPGGRRQPGCGRIRTGRRYRPAREHLAHGLRARAGGNRRLAGRADGLTPSSCLLRVRHSDACRCRTPYQTLIGSSVVGSGFRTASAAAWSGPVCGCDERRRSASSAGLVHAESRGRHRPASTSSAGCSGGALCETPGDADTLG